MPIFQHTLQQVLDCTKTQTARIWKDYYRIGDSRNPYENQHHFHGHGSFFTLWSVKSGSPRIVYTFGGTYSVQPGRGQKGVGLMRIQKLWKQDVREYTDDDVRREGFSAAPIAARTRFLELWCKMHDIKAYDTSGNAGWWLSEYLPTRPDELYTALCMQFKLVQ